MGIIPQFTQGQINATIDAFESRVISQFIWAYVYMGEEFVNKARVINTYTNRTGNLRSSIGYAVIVDGNIFQQDIEAVGDILHETQQLIEELRTRWDGIVLIGFAGKSYAAAVESYNFDVITGSAPMDSEIQEMMESIVRKNSASNFI